VPAVTPPVFTHESARVATPKILIVRANLCEGAIVTDKPADLIGADRNIFEIDPHTIGDTKVVTTNRGRQDRL
jgi:hypothetical protein